MVITLDSLNSVSSIANLVSFKIKTNPEFEFFHKNLKFDRFFALIILSEKHTTLTLEQFFLTVR